MKKSKMLCMASLLSAAMLISGCGGDSEAERGTVISPETTVSESTAGVADKTVSLGRMDGGTYINEYVGYGCTLDESWQFYTAEELQEIPDNVEELFEGSELEEVSADLPQITDMMAENVDDMTSINVVYSQLSMQERLAQSMLSEEELVDATLEQKDMLIQAFAQAGIEVTEIKKVTVTFLGEERPAMHTTASIQGIPYYTLQLFDHNLGKYYVTLTLASYIEDNTESLTELFHEVE